MLRSFALQKRMNPTSTLTKRLIFFCQGEILVPSNITPSNLIIVSTGLFWDQPAVRTRELKSSEVEVSLASKGYKNTSTFLCGF